MHGRICPSYGWICGYAGWPRADGGRACGARRLDGRGCSRRRDDGGRRRPSRPLRACAARSKVGTAGLWPARGGVRAAAAVAGARGSGAAVRGGVAARAEATSPVLAVSARPGGGAVVRCGSGALPGREYGGGRWSFGSGLCGAVTVASLSWGGRSDGAGLRRRTRAVGCRHSRRKPSPDLFR